MSRVLDNRTDVRYCVATCKEAPGDQARCPAQAADHRLHRGDVARARLPAVRAGDRGGGRAGVDVRRPPPPLGPREGGLPRARRVALACPPPDAHRGAPRRACARSSCRSRADRTSTSLPVIGEIAAGGPSRPTRTPARRMSVPEILAPSGDAYVLRVRGDSMVDAHITDGDFVVIRPQQTARNGDIVVAQVEENAVTLKRFFREKGRVRLQPANEPVSAACSTTTCASRASSSGSSAAWTDCGSGRGCPQRLHSVGARRPIRGCDPWTGASSE